MGGIILSVKDQKRRELLVKKAVRENLTRKELENIIRIERGNRNLNSAETTPECLTEEFMKINFRRST